MLRCYLLNGTAARTVAPLAASGLCQITVSTRSVALVVQGYNVK